MATKFSTKDRESFAKLAGVTPAYISQCISGLRDMEAARARRLEAASRNRIRVWDLCPNTWREIWPELANRKGAPKAEEPAKAEA